VIGDESGVQVPILTGAIPTGTIPTSSIPTCTNSGAN